MSTSVKQEAGRCRHGYADCVRCGCGSYADGPIYRAETLAETFPHYHKPCPFGSVDVYRVLMLFEVSDPALQHAIKKLLVAGGRGVKDAERDVQEAIVALQRWGEMRSEEAAVLVAGKGKGSR